MEWQLYNDDGNWNRTYHSRTKSLTVSRDFKDVSNKWVVKVVMHSNLLKHIVYKKFLTKEQAYNYAENYMRKN